MTLCPIALVAGCKKCFALGFCPLKTVIGDFKPEHETPVEQDAPDVSQEEASAQEAADEPDSGGDDATTQDE